MAALLAYLGLAACALVGLPGPVDYHTRTWTTDDGLPHNTVTRAIQDRAGFLWFGTPGGLARFDGREFRQINLSLERLHFVSNIRGLAEERPGVLLVIASPNLLLRIEDGVASPHPCSAHLPRLAGTPVDLYVEPSGAVWVATVSGALLRWSPDGTAAFFGLETPVATRSKRFSFATAGDGSTWVASDGFVAIYEEGRLEPHPETPVGPLLIAPSNSGDIWICTSGQLLRLSGRQLHVESDAVPWKDDFDSVRHLMETRQGDLFVTGRGRILRYRDSHFQSIPTPYSLATYIMEDSEDNLWVGTNGSGAAHMRERSHRIFNERSGLRRDSVSALAEGRDGRIWVANRNGGLHRLDPRNGQLDHPGGIPNPTPVDVVAVDNSGVVWFGGLRSGLWRLPADGTGTAERLAMPESDVNALLPTRSGHVWFATIHGEVGRYLDGRLELFDDSDNPTLGSVYAMAEDAEGSVWLGGRQGILVRWDGRGLERVVAPEVDATIHALTVGRSGHLWIGTANGLVVREADRFHLLTTEQGLPDDIIYNVLEDDQERLWLATRRGLFYAYRSELIAAARGTVGHLSANRFGPEQGLRGFTPTPNYYPGALKTSAGTLWFASTQGAVEIDPSRMPRHKSPPPLRFDTVRWDGEATPVTASGTLHLPSGRHRVDIKLLILSYTDPANMALEHRLEGFDRAWIDTGSDRLASYTNLAAGTYRLYARARNTAGTWSEEKPLLNLTIVPAWWETLSARIGAAALLIVVVAVIVRAVAQRRLQQRVRLLEQQHALAKERTRIARDLHDELGAGLTEVGLLADRLVTTAPREFAPQLSGLAWRTRRLATDLSGIVWTMNASHASLDHLAVFLRRYTERLFRNTGARCVVEGVETIPALPLLPEVQHQLLAATKEALNNVLKHARATEVGIALRYAGGVFEARIRDNGVGCRIESADTSDGNGLRNMRSRIEELGGSFDFTSTAGAGTTVTFRVPLPQEPKHD